VGYSLVADNSGLSSFV